MFCRGAVVVLLSVFLLLFACTGGGQFPVPGDPTDENVDEELQTELEVSPEEDEREELELHANPRENPEDDDNDSECETTSDCVAASTTSYCCGSCRNHAYSRDALEELRAYCRENPELRQSCPPLACKFEGGVATCKDGQCVILRDPREPYF